MANFLALVCLSAMLGLSTSVEKTTSYFSVPKQPTYVIVLSRQRSSSTTTSQIIGSHPCALFGNEIWGRAQDVLGAHDYANMSWPEIRDETHRFLTIAREHICSKAILDGTIADSCGGQCTIVVKEFDIHSISEVGMDTLMQDDNIDFVVLERDIPGEYCSYAEAAEHDDWGTVPGAHKEGQTHVDCEVIPEDFIHTHEKWFARVRSALHRNGRSFVDVPFSLIASCRLREFAQSLFGRMGFPLPVTFPIEYPSSESFTTCNHQ
ncbi:unnamed protein product [Scytosiphon promiscuus]